MTSLHRLITIILVWLVVAFLGATMQGLALSLSPLLVTLLYIALLGAAAVATWAVARSG